MSFAEILSTIKIVKHNPKGFDTWEVSKTITNLIKQLEEIDFDCNEWFIDVYVENKQVYLVNDEKAIAYIWNDSKERLEYFYGNIKTLIKIKE